MPSLKLAFDTEGWWWNGPAVAPCWTKRKKRLCFGHFANGTSFSSHWCMCCAFVVSTKGRPSSMAIAVLGFCCGQCWERCWSRERGREGETCNGPEWKNETSCVWCCGDMDDVSASFTCQQQWQDWEEAQDTSAVTLQWWHRESPSLKFLLAWLFTTKL